MNTSNGAKQKNREKKRDMTERINIVLVCLFRTRIVSDFMTCTSYTIAHTYYMLVQRTGRVKTVTDGDVGVTLTPSWVHP